MWAIGLLIVLLAIIVRKLSKEIDALRESTIRKLEAWTRKCETHQLATAKNTVDIASHDASSEEFKKAVAAELLYIRNRIDQLVDTVNKSRNGVK